MQLFIGQNGPEFPEFFGGKAICYVVDGMNEEVHPSAAENAVSRPFSAISLHQLKRAADQYEILAPKPTQDNSTGPSQLFNSVQGSLRSLLGMQHNATSPPVQSHHFPSLAPGANPSTPLQISCMVISAFQETRQCLWIKWDPMIKRATKNMHRLVQGLCMDRCLKRHQTPCRGEGCGGGGVGWE